MSIIPNQTMSSPSQRFLMLDDHEDGEGYDMAGRSRGDVAERRMERALRQREEEERNRFNERCRAMRPETRRYFRRAEADAGPSRRSGSSGESSN